MRNKETFRRLREQDAERPKGKTELQEEFIENMIESGKVKRQKK